MWSACWPIAKNIALSSDYEIIHVIPQEFIVDGQDGISDPVGYERHAHGGGSPHHHRAGICRKKTCTAAWNEPDFRLLT